MIEVIPALLEKDFAEIERKIHLVESLVTWVQVDIADNTIVQNTSWLDPTPFATIQTSVSKELHMMVDDPLAYLEPFYHAGFKRFYAHVEGKGVEDFLVKASEMDIEVGLALDGPTAVEKIWPYLDNLDCLLVMGVNAGFSGQPFREDTVDKIQKIHDVYFDLPICVDGAMNDANAAKVIAAGATRINSTSFLFQSDDIKAQIEKLRSLGETIREER